MSFGKYRVFCDGELSGEFNDFVGCIDIMDIDRVFSADELGAEIDDFI